MLKKEIVKLESGESITIRERTLAADLELQSLQKVTLWDIYRVSMDSLSFDTLNNTKTNKEDMKKIVTAIAKVNGWTDSDKEKETEKKEPSTMNTLPENSDGLQNK